MQLLTLQAPLSTAQSDDESPPLPEEAEEEPSESPLALPPTEVSTRSPEDTCTYQSERLFCCVARCPDSHFACSSYSDSQKKIENGSGHLTGTLLASWHTTFRPFTHSSSVFVPFRVFSPGEAELADETAGAADADADAKAAAASGVATPAEGEVAEKKEDAPKRRSHEEEEEEDNTQSYAEYLASKAAAAIEGVTQLSKRVVSEWTGEGEVVKKDAEDAFFAAKEKTQKALKARKEKNTVSSLHYSLVLSFFLKSLATVFRSRSTESSPLRRSPLPPPEVDEVDSRADEVESDEREVLPEEAEEELEVPSEATPEVPPPSPERRRPPPSTLPTRPPSPRSPKARPGPTFAVNLQPRVAFRLPLA